jgi:hypothetical protein
MEQLVELDKELYLFLNNLGNPAWDNFWNFITNKFASIPFYALLVFFMYRALGLKQTLMCLGMVALLITTTDQLANLFKHGFERPRPCRQEGVIAGDLDIFLHMRRVLQLWSCFLVPCCGHTGKISFRSLFSGVPWSLIAGST